MSNYLDELPISLDEKTKLENLAAESPAALLSMIRANRSAFENYLGGKRVDELSAILENKVTHRERKMLKSLVNRNRELGAVIGMRVPAIKSPEYDMEERDRLFEELERLKKTDNTSPQVRRKITMLTKRLNEMLAT